MDAKKIKNLIILGILVIFVLILASSSFYTVNEGEFAYITQFGAIKEIRTEAGLYFKIPFVQDVNTVTKKQMIYNVNPSEVLTADKKAMIVDSYSIWQITDVTTFIRTVNNVSEMEKRIDASAYSVIKNVMGGMQQNEIITDGDGGRSSLNKTITTQVATSLKSYGVEIKSVEIKRFDLPPDNTSAVYARMISERSQMAASFKADGEYEAAKIRNETDKEVSMIVTAAEAEAQKLKGEGEQIYISTLSALYNDPNKASFYLFTRELEALKLSLTGDKTIVLGPDSPLVQILNRTN